MWVFFGASVLLALTPGANNLLGLHHGMTHGVRHGLAGLGGRLAAFTLLIAAVAAGLGQLLAASETALTIIKWAGVAYLFYLGLRLLWSTFRGKNPTKELPTAPTSAWRVSRKEFGVALTNPKAILIFTAFVPQFIDAGHGSFPAQIALLGAVYLPAEFLAGSVYVVAGAAAKTIRLSRTARRNVDRGPAWSSSAWPACSRRRTRDPQPVKEYGQDGDVDQPAGATLVRKTHTDCGHAL